MGLRRLNWGEVTQGRPPWSATSGRLFAIWPSPVDHDVCFEEAGAEDMEDTDAEWDDAFSAMLDRLLSKLAEIGPPRLIEGEYPGTGSHLSRSLRDALLAAALDDNFAPRSVIFDAPARASVRTSDGHALLWVWIGFDLRIESLVSEIAGPVPTRCATLNWSKLW
jgi:hypothetical protein